MSIWPKMKCLAYLIVLPLCFITSPSYGPILVQHSQTTSVPSCPSDNSTLLWSGYSLVGNYLDAGHRSNQDLGTTGSCVADFMPLPFIECSVLGCDYGTGSDHSLWLVTERYVNESRLHLTDFPDVTPERLAAAKSRISRCSVCEVQKPILVRHSQTAMVPDCPYGWSIVWEGYSLGTTTLARNYDAGQDLGKPGSCLRKFVPNPSIPCWQDRCDYDKDYALWMLNLHTAKDISTKRNYNTGNKNRPRISRCAVCIKD